MNAVVQTANANQECSLLHHNVRSVIAPRGIPFYTQTLRLT